MKQSTMGLIRRKIDCFQYLFILMQRQKENRGGSSTISFNYTGSKYREKEYCPLQQQHRTERKGSLAARVGLSDLPSNQFNYTSNTNAKMPDYKMSRQASTDLNKSMGKSESSKGGGSRWLDNEKEMMEFIINLKSKKSESKYSRSKKLSEHFEFEDHRDDQKQLFCNRMLLMKKIEKYQKQAISSFYQKDYNKCFNQLSKAESLIKKERIVTPQHQLYINYLYAEFYYKLDEVEKWKMYLQRGKAAIRNLDDGSSPQSGQINEYIMNLKALDVCLALHQEKYEKVLSLVDQIRDQGLISSKIRRRISNCEITALRKLYRYKQAISCIDSESRAIEHDSELNEDKKDSEFSKLFQQKIDITTEFISTESAINMVEYLIGFEETSKGETPAFSYYNPRIYHSYASLLNKTDEKIKLLFFYEKWIDLEPSKKQTLKIKLELFTIYYQMGIYEKALSLFDEISSENVVYLGCEYLMMFANIKHFHGEEKEAINIINKSIDICETQAEKALYMYRLLELDLEVEGESLRGEKQQTLEGFLRQAEKQNVQHVCQLYLEYLRSRNQQQKAQTFSNKMKSTAQFNECHCKSGQKPSLQMRK